MTNPLSFIRKHFGKILLALLVLFFLWQTLFHADYWKYVWRHLNRSDVGNIELEAYAGCNARAMMEEISDEDFSKAWKKDSQTYGFTYEDVKFEMEESCPIKSDERVEFLYQSQGRTVIQKIKKLQDYQRKFLNREFTALKEE